MSTIFEAAGKQYTVNKGDTIAIDKLDNKAKDKVEFDKVLLIKDKELIVGNPYIENAKVKATVLEQVRDKKVWVFKFKRTKNYKKLRGHKQHYTLIKIDSIETK